MKRKRILVTCALALATFFTARAQLSITPKAGLTYFDPKFRGYNAGVGLNIPLSVSGLLSFQAELTFVQKGMNEKAEFALSRNTYPYPSYNVRFNNSSRLDYLEVPLLARISFGQKMKVFLNAGPSIAYGLGGKTKFTGIHEGENIKKEGKILYSNKPPMGALGDIYNKYMDQRLDVGLQFGGGIGIKAGPGALIFEARYGIGLTPVTRIQNNQSNYIGKQQKNRVLAMSMGYAIPIAQR